jgi:hypothetical protein
MVKEIISDGTVDNNTANETENSGINVDLEEIVREVVEMRQIEVEELISKIENNM